MLVAQTDDLESLRRLLEAGAATEGVDKGGRTALWYAAHAGKLEAVRLLLQHGASVDHADAAGQSAFAAACAARATAIVDLMLHKGPRLQARPPPRDTPLPLPAN